MGALSKRDFNNLTRAWNVASTLSSSCGSIFSSNRLGSGTAIRGTLRLINSSIWKVIGFVRLLGNVKAGLAFKSTVVSHVHFPTVFIAEHVYRPPSSDSAPILKWSAHFVVMYCNIYSVNKMFIIIIYFCLSF